MANDLFDKQLAEMLVKARKEKGYTQNQLSKLVEMTQPVITRLEKAGVSPKADTLQKYLSPLGKSIFIGDVCMKLLIICGGPSFERDISLNSARSVYDNISGTKRLDISIVFVDNKLSKHKITSQFLYSNTVSDFDFKLHHDAEKLDEQGFIDEILANDIVFPIMHGKYCEDGQIQKLLERLNVPYVGSPSIACAKMYNKENADYELLKSNGFYTIPKLYISPTDSNYGMKIRRFFDEFSLTGAVVKPVEGGSSIGVVFGENAESIIEKLSGLLKKHGKVIIEPICEGKEFTVIILQNKKGKPVALMPTEIEIIKDDDRIFNKRRKYLATTETHYYCPARFDSNIIDKIRSRAQELFTIAGAKDFLRIDGWILDNNKIYFSDFNPISGMEQNSFIFQQAAKCGFSHRQLLEYILTSACERQWLKFPITAEEADKKKCVNVLMGGWTSERQVSLMSGTNVWLKLNKSNKYSPVPYLLHKKGDKILVSKLPYALCLNHTVEEILYQLELNEKFDYISDIREKLGLDMKSACLPEKSGALTLKEFIKESKEQGAYVFLGLHGGFGEGGDIQKELQEGRISFNGCLEGAARLCMDKYKTGEKINNLGIKNLRSCKKIKLNVAKLKTTSTEDLWKDIKIIGTPFIAKPNSDGCSTGVVILQNKQDLETYINLFKDCQKEIKPNTFFNQPEKIAMPLEGDTEIIFEEYIKTDDIIIENKELNYDQKSGWLEFTVGVLEKKGKYKSLYPSITVANAGILSVEEKFQGGTGVNITPPPENIISKTFLGEIMKYVEIVAKELGIKDYSRIDIFANNKTNEVIVIEANTLPGLSPSTVLFQQAGANGMTPLELLEEIISQ